MQKNKLNLHIYGKHLLNPYKTVVSHLKLLLHSTLREFSAGALVYSRPFPLRQSHTKVMKKQVPIIIIVITTSLFTGRIRS